MIDSRLPRLASQLARLKRSHRYSPANYSSVCLAPFSQPVFWFGEDKAGKNAKMVYLRYGHLYFWKLLRLGALKVFFEFWRKNPSFSMHQVYPQYFMGGGWWRICRRNPRLILPFQERKTKKTARLFPGILLTDHSGILP